ncbi:MAG: hypothetical protein CVV02_06945 [Firmicutes bacterium HGW-Firmicutes-7]|nr:MAG: hypothetical protein CVV02_06945 [Firmicutes bacterium HGW-Firmicutes-7]
MKRVMALFFSVSILLLQLSIGVYAGETRDKFDIEYDGKVHQYTSNVVTLNIDGKAVATGEMPAIIIDSRTLVPAREVFESAGFNAKVDWNGEKQEVYISYNDQKIVLKIGSNIAFVNNNPITLDVPAKLIRDTSQKNPKTMIPLRFVTENLGYKIEWNQSSYTASITSLSQNPEVPVEETPEVPIEEIKNGDELDELNSDKANRLLPTELATNPVTWSSIIAPVEQSAKSVISAQNNSLVSITSVEYKSDSRSFSIQASGPISFVENTFMESDSKYVVDIYNANKVAGNATYSDNPIVTAVRTGQQEDRDGKKVTRVVFDLKSTSASYDLSISGDRKTLNFVMKDNNLSKVHLGQNEKGDYIRLTGTSAPEVTAFRLSNPDRIVFDMERTVSLVGKQTKNDTLGQYILSMRTDQFKTSTARVVVETDGHADYSITKIDNVTTLIQMHEPTYDNIKYENTTIPIITLENVGSRINLEGITYEDKYNTKKYIINLPGNYEDVFGTGNMHIDDSIISQIEIKKNNSGNTSLVIHSKSVYVYRLEADNENLYIKAYKPKEIYSKIVVIDTGHGGKDPGASANGYYEKDLNLAITHYLKEYLDADSSIKVYYTRLDDTFIELVARTDFANEVEADFLISIHNNALGETANGTETIYFKDADRSGLNSNELAAILQQNIVNAVGLKNRGIKDNNSLSILRRSNMPAAIVEVGFVTSKIDIAKISDKNVQKNAAKAIYNSIVQVFAEYPTRR